MSESPGTLEVVARELARAFTPLADRLAAGQVRPLLAELGLEFPPELEAHAAFVEKVGEAVAAIAGLPEDLVALENAIAAEDNAQAIQIVGRITESVRGIATALEGAGTALQAAPPLPGMNPADVAQFGQTLAVRLLEYVLLTYMEGYFQRALYLLRLLGLVEITQQPGIPGDATHPRHTHRALHLERFSDLFTSPETLFRTLYGWGDPGFDGQQLLEALHDALFALSVPARLEPDPAAPGRRRLGVLWMTLAADSTLTPPGLRATLTLALGSDFELSLPFPVPGWALTFKARGELEADLGVTVTPPATLEFLPPAGTLQGEVRLGLQASPTPPADRVVLLGRAGGSRLEVARIGAEVLSEMRWSGGSAAGDFGFEGTVEGGKLVVSLADADGFLGKLFSGVGFEADFAFGFGWRAGGGVYFTGSAGLEIQLPAHIDLGPVEIDALTLSVGIEDGKLPIALAGDIKAELGPLQAVVEQIGFATDLSIAPDHKGTLGPIDLGFRFKPPKGVGLSIDAGVVKGGGYLFIDVDRGEYAGALELVIADFLNLTAIGLITTRNPDGSPGFSLLIIITAEFGSGIQLGFGFTLLAVGGLLGVNRTMNLQALMEGVRTGAINSVMFPHDVIANAPRIISDLKALFPQQEGTFLIGPMAKLGWGTPPLVSVALGVIIEIPGNIAILGVLKIVLPTEEEALIRLQVNFAGAIEFDKKRLYFFAALFESRIVFMTIEGEMGLLVAFGDDANFVVSVGGFHPRFSPPPLPFPSPRRIAVSLVNTSVARVGIEGYFAVTSNTVQFGARAELFFGLDEVNVSGHLAFDALFQFSPFHFVIEISASFSVTVFGIGLFSVRLAGSLEGPAPWRAHGTASISILFFDISVDVDVTWGESADTMLPPIEVMPLFQAELDKAECWRALLPAGSNLRVSLRTLPEGDPTLVLHPVGVLRVAQRRMPLELKLDKIGNQRPTDVNRLSLRVTSTGLARRGDALEQFALAQFQNMSDGQKLSQAAFTLDKGGVEISAAGAALRSSGMVKRVVRYELIVLDSNFKRFTRRFFQFTARLFEFFLRGNSAARAAVSHATHAARVPFADRITVAAESYTVAFQRDNTAAAAEASAFTSEASARDWMERRVAEDPSLAGQLHVIPSFERAA